MKLIRLKRTSGSLLLLCAMLAGCKGKQTETAAPGQAAPAAAPTFQVDAATAGSIHGVVRLEGWVPPVYKQITVDKLMASDPACVAAAKKNPPDFRPMADRKGNLGNAFVYISSGLEGKQFAVPTAAVTIDQAGCWFRPRVLGIQTGQTLDITNSDPVTHNIHPMAKVNREWNHSQGPGDPPMHRTFAKQEVMIPVKCNIHDWMHAYIGAVDNPYFATTRDDGSFDLPNLPPGTYTVTAWHETLGTQQATVTVPASGRAETELLFHAR